MIFALLTFLKMDSIEQKAAIKFCVKLDHSATKTFDMLKNAYGDASLSRTSIFDRHKWFRSGRTSITDDPRSGRPSDSKTDENVEVVSQLLQKSWRLTCRGIADTLSMSKTVVHEIFNNVLAKRKVCSQFVPHSLHEEGVLLQLVLFHVHRQFLSIILRQPLCSIWATIEVCVGEGGLEAAPFL